MDYVKVSAKAISRRGVERDVYIVAHERSSVVRERWEYHMLLSMALKKSRMKLASPISTEYIDKPEWLD